MEFFQRTAINGKTVLLFLKTSFAGQLKWLSLFGSTAQFIKLKNNLFVQALVTVANLDLFKRQFI